MSDSVIHISELTRRFGAKTALASVSVSMQRGAVYGLVGANGAGKTTLIKHVLGLLRAESGSVRVFGLDPVADPVGVLSRIGGPLFVHEGKIIVSAACIRWLLVRPAELAGKQAAGKRTPHEQADRLLNLLMDGLRYGAPGTHRRAR
jgi:ABC-type branched-subunit amino acid transport system ATPase component